MQENPWVQGRPQGMARAPIGLSYGAHHWVPMAIRVGETTRRKPRIFHATMQWKTAAGWKLVPLPALAGAMRFQWMGTCDLFAGGAGAWDGHSLLVEKLMNGVMVKHVFNLCGDFSSHWETQSYGWLITISD